MLLAVGAGIEGFGVFCLCPNLALTIAKLSNEIFCPIVLYGYFYSADEQP